MIAWLAKVVSIEQLISKRHVSGAAENAKFEDVPVDPAVWIVQFDSWAVRWHEKPQFSVGDTVLVRITSYKRED